MAPERQTLQSLSCSHLAGGNVIRGLRQVLLHSNIPWVAKLVMQPTALH